MIFPLKTPSFVKNYFSDFVWDIKSSEKTIYLTFDDGPVDEVTPFVLDELKKVNAKATFFCIGDNIRKHPDVFKRLKEEGHLASNHTYNHLSGWKTKNNSYYENIEKCESLLDQKQKLFRPPYGRISSTQAKHIKKRYRIIMWDVLSGDFEKNLKPETCLKSCIEKTKDGSIVIFHDSFKAFRVLKYVLPRYIDHFSKMGFKFKPIQL